MYAARENSTWEPSRCRAKTWVTMGVTNEIVDRLPYRARSVRNQLPNSVGGGVKVHAHAHATLPLALGRWNSQTDDCCFLMTPCPSLSLTPAQSLSPTLSLTVRTECRRRRRLGGIDAMTISLLVITMRRRRGCVRESWS